MLETIAGILLILLVIGMVVAFAVSSWRRSEREQQRWQSRRGDDPGQQEDMGATRSHWGGFGRPGGGSGL